MKSETQIKYMKMVVDKLKIILELSYKIFYKTRGELDLDDDAIDDESYWKTIEKDFADMKQIRYEMEGLYEELDNIDIDNFNIFAKISSKIRDHAKRILKVSKIITTLFLKGAHKENEYDLDTHVDKFEKDNTPNQILTGMLAFASLLVAKAVVGMKSNMSRLKLISGSALVGSFAMDRIFRIANSFNDESIQILNNWIGILKDVNSINKVNLKYKKKDIVIKAKNIKNCAKKQLVIKNGLDRAANLAKSKRGN